MSKARRVAKILDGELKSNEIGLDSPDGKVQTQKDANVTLDDRIKNLEVTPATHTHPYAPVDHDHSADSHDHHGEYSDKDHKHDDDYEAKGHTHNQYQKVNNAADQYHKLDDKIDSHTNTSHNYLPRSGGVMDPKAPISWDSNTGSITGLEEAKDETSPVRLKEFQTELDKKFNDSAIKDALAAETQARKDGDAKLTDDKANKSHSHSGYAKTDHSHEAEAHTHSEYETQADAADTTARLDSKIDSKAPSNHSHAGYAPASHTHPSDNNHTHNDYVTTEQGQAVTNELQANIDGVDADLAKEATSRADEDTRLNNRIDGKANEGHTHAEAGDYATIEYSDSKDDALALRVESLEGLAEGLEADLGGSYWLYDSATHSSHFTTMQNPDNENDRVAAVDSFQQWFHVSKTSKNAEQVPNWSIANQHRATLHVTGSFVDAKYTVGEVQDKSDKWVIDCYYQGGADGQTWNGGAQYHLSMSAMDTTLEETFASIGHTHDPDGDLHAQVDTNRQDIALIKGSLADKMEVKLILENNWVYAGENAGSPRDGKFTTDNWFFNKATALSVNKKSTSMNQNWNVVDVGDEVRIMYNEDSQQPVDERYFGLYTVKSIVNNSGDILSVQLEFVDGMGTIVDSKQYSIRVRGARLPDTSARIEDQQKQIDDLKAVIAGLGPITWKYIGENTAPKNPGEFSIRHSNSVTSIEIHDKSVNDVYWEPGRGRQDDLYPSDLPVGVFDKNGEMEVVGETVHIECSRKDKAYTSVHFKVAVEEHALTVGYQYLINVPGLLPQFPFPIKDALLS